MSFMILRFLSAAGINRRLKEVPPVVKPGTAGPGRFVAEFARTARSAMGIDISPVFVENGCRFAKEQGLTNVPFSALDFQEADIKAMGWEGKCDLVFSSITPAVRGLKALDNLIAMSRGWCFNVGFVYKYNELHDRILQEVFAQEPMKGKVRHSDKHDRS